MDEKSQIQAVDRTVPVLPMQPGPIERRSYDYQMQLPCLTGRDGS